MRQLLARLARKKSSINWRIESGNLLEMNKRIGIALLISVSLHAAAMAVSIAIPRTSVKATIDNSSSKSLAIQIVDAAPPLPDAMSPLTGQGADAIAKLDGAVALTSLADKLDENRNETPSLNSTIGDSANAVTKTYESSAAGAQGKTTGLKSVLISALQFDPDFYPPNGGKLKVRIDIDEAGIPKAVTRISHSPKNLNIDYFLESILEARFIPAEKAGVLVANTVVVEIDLKLEDSLLAQHFIKK
jgi:hypothetical protein